MDSGDVLGRDQEANLWMVAFMSAHDILGLSFLTSRRFQALEGAGLDTQAAAAGQEGLDAGAVDLFVANRLGIVYERKLDNVAAALAVSLALAWPRREGSPTTYDAIAKRRGPDLIAACFGGCSSPSCLLLLGLLGLLLGLLGVRNCLGVGRGSLRGRGVSLRSLGSRRQGRR